MEEKMDNLKIKGKLIKINWKTQQQDDIGEIELSPFTPEEISNLKEGDEVLVKCKIRDVRYNQEMIVIVGHHINIVYHFLPQSQHTHNV